MRCMVQYMYSPIHQSIRFAVSGVREVTGDVHEPRQKFVSIGSGGWSMENGKWKANPSDAERCLGHFIPPTWGRKMPGSLRLP